MNKLEQLMAQIQELIKSALAPKVEITKSVDVEQRRALFVAMEPDVFDAHGHITTAEEVEKACNNFNKHCMKANLFHRVETDAVDIQQSFITLNDMTLDNGQEISKGTWLMWMHFPEDNPESERIWKDVKSGEIQGISIGARGYLTDVEENE